MMVGWDLDLDDLRTRVPDNFTSKHDEEVDDDDNVVNELVLTTEEEVAEFGASVRPVRQALTKVRTIRAHCSVRKAG
jgi:hypothetical protein